MPETRDLSNGRIPVPSMRLLGGVAPDDVRSRYANSSGIARRMFDHLIEVARHPERVEAHGISAVGRISSGAVHPRHRPDEACYPFWRFC